eukprot:2085610-Amphidinium_carterae.1
MLNLYMRPFIFGAAATDPPHGVSARLRRKASLIQCRRTLRPLGLCWEGKTHILRWAATCELSRKASERMFRTWSSGPKRQKCPE